jgi:hypothetical protein
LPASRVLSRCCTRSIDVAQHTATDPLSQVYCAMTERQFQWHVRTALELKSATGRVKPKQREFLDMAVRVPGVLAAVVRPADWPALLRDLDDLEARRRGTPAAEEV